jgi:hypothetical protein
MSITRYGRGFFIATATLLMIASSFAQQQTSQQATAQIDKAGLLILIRQTLTALDLSNKSGNYTILREISAPSFASVNDAARLSATFGNQRARGIDYSGTLAYEPQLTAGPEITKDGILRFAGFFPAASSQIKFEMYFAPVNGQWKLAGLMADLAPSGPVAPTPAIQQPMNPQTTKTQSQTNAVKK